MYDLLKGTRVLDLTSVVLGPFATQHLGDFGADVIKIEPPSGDIFRYVRPARSEAMGAGFLNLNRNKRSICLDLKNANDQATFHALLSEADVLVHNMRATAAVRLGIGANQIRDTYPRLVYCAAPGFGSRGPKADNPAYDDIIQAASGIADLNKDCEGEPRFLPTILCDKVSGLHLAMAVLAGVVQQTKTGQGCSIEVPMFEGMVSFLMAEQLAGKTFRPAQGGLGYERLTSPYRKPYRTKDSYIAVLPYNGTHWFRILDYLEHELANADWVQSPPERSARVGELYQIIAQAMPVRTTEQWIDIFADLDIPCTRVNSMEDLLSDEHLAQVGLFATVEHPSEGALTTIRSPFWVEGVARGSDRPTPELDKEDKSTTWQSPAQPPAQPPAD